MSLHVFFPFRYLLTGGLLVLLLSACVSVPEENAEPALSQAEAAAIVFGQARALYQAGDYVAAAGLMKALAQQGHLQAQYALGYMYHYGRGVPHNEREAIRWMSVAAARGHPKAQAALELLEQAGATPLDAQGAGQ